MRGDVLGPRFDQGSGFKSDSKFPSYVGDRWWDVTATNGREPVSNGKLSISI